MAVCDTTCDYQTLVPSPDDGTEKIEEDKKRRDENIKPETTEDETNRDQSCGDTFRRLGRAFLEGVFRSLGKWIVDEIRNIFDV